MGSFAPEGENKTSSKVVEQTFSERRGEEKTSSSRKIGLAPQAPFYEDSHVFLNHAPYSRTKLALICCAPSACACHLNVIITVVLSSLCNKRNLKKQAMRERGVDGKARRNAGGAEERARGHGWGGLSERMEGRGATDTGRTT